MTATIIEFPVQPKLAPSPNTSSLQLDEQAFLDNLGGASSGNTCHVGQSAPPSSPPKPPGTPVFARAAHAHTQEALELLAEQIILRTLYPESFLRSFLARSVDETDRQGGRLLEAILASIPQQLQAKEMLMGELRISHSEHTGPMTELEVWGAIQKLTYGEGNQAPEPRH
jgi:hypothetical protein